MTIFGLISRILIIVGLSFTGSAESISLSLQDKITESARSLIVVADDDVISRPFNSAKPRPKTHQPFLLPFLCISFVSSFTENTFVVRTAERLLQSVQPFARGPPAFLNS